MAEMIPKKLLEQLEKGAFERGMVTERLRAQQLLLEIALQVNEKASLEQKNGVARVANEIAQEFVRRSNDQPFEEVKP